MRGMLEISTVDRKASPIFAFWRPPASPDPVLTGSYRMVGPFKVRGLYYRARVISVVSKSLLRKRKGNEEEGPPQRDKA